MGIDNVRTKTKINPDHLPGQRNTYIYQAYIKPVGILLPTATGGKV